ncbi:MAG: UvrD-helicase domain-containing protein [Clostridiales bacterium]|nr:UvrD-helicase domain-containing protein [Clostridiales bacterium]
MDFTPMQAAAIAHRGSALLISAGAGSGKTRVLIERLMSLIDEGLDVDRFLVITYTRAAAAELRARLSLAISQRLAADPADRRMRRQAALIYRARINTIHAFCSDIIRESAHTVGVRPDFRQMDEAESTALLRETLEELLERKYPEMDEGFRLLTDMMGAGRDDSRLFDIVLETYSAVQSHPYPEKWMQGWIDMETDPSADAGSTPWGGLLLRRAGRKVRYWKARMEAELYGLELDEDTKKAYLPSWQETIASLASFAAAIDSGWDAAHGFGAVSFPRLGTIRGRKGDDYIERVKAIRESCKSAMKKLAESFSVASAGLMADMAAIKPVTDELYKLVLELSRDYAEAKKRRGALDFSDLEHLSLAILADPETGRPTAKAGEVSARFAEILVDEYQDVNRVQEMIFAAVSNGGRNVTMVGDVKQSIYRFRLADPTIFLEKYASFAEYPAPEGEAVRIRMAHNFRSRPEILSLVNKVFARLMSPELGEMSYGEDEAMLAGRSDPAAFAEPVEICLCQTPEGADRVEYEAKCAASYLYKLLNSGVELDGRPLRSSDCAILLRSPGGRAGAFVAALEAYGIPASVAGGTSGLFDGFENSCLLSILRVIDNPIQDIPLIAALRSPVWRFNADELAHIRAAAPGDFYTALKARAEDDEKCASFLAELDELRELAARLPADGLVSAVLDRTGLPAIAEARQAGAAERLYMVQSYARSCEDAGCRGLYGFLSRIDSAEPPKLSRSAEGGVTIMSIHSSKGLEFPVVLLCDLARQFNLQDARKPLLIHRDLGAGPKFIDTKRGIEYPTLARAAVSARITAETLSEEMRVLYVAMTRPREKLVCFCSVKDAEEHLAKLRLGLTDPPAADVLEDGKCLGDWLLSALLCDPDFKYTLLEPAKPPRAAALAENDDTAPEFDEALANELRASLSWRAPGNSQGLPSKVTATALKSGFRSAEAGEDAEEIAPVRDERREQLRRPAFVAGEKGLSPTERGTALHMAMQLIDFARCGSLDEISGEIKRMETMRLLTPGQAASIDPSKLMTFFRSKLGRRALAAKRLEREFKFSVLLPTAFVYGRGEGDVLLQGVIDLFFEEDDGIVLVDFKNDRVTKATRAARAGEYAGQLNAYAEALARITGKRVKEKRLFFFACDE